MNIAIKSTVALLTFSFVMAAAPKAEASIWSVIQGLLSPSGEFIPFEPPPNAPLALSILESSNTYREFKVRVEPCDGGFRDVALQGLNAQAYVYGDSACYGLTLAVKKSGRWVVKDYVIVGPRANIQIYKHSRGDFRMSVMNLR